MKTIAITGASGFVGTNIKRFFSNLDYKIVAISRDILNDEAKLQEVIDNADVIINLAGANIIGRWTQEYKEQLYKSRLETTKKEVSGLMKTSFRN